MKTTEVTVTLKFDALYRGNHDTRSICVSLHTLLNQALVEHAKENRSVWFTDPQVTVDLPAKEVA